MPAQDPIIAKVLGAVFAKVPGAQWARYAAPGQAINPASPAFRVIVNAGDVDGDVPGMMSMMARTGTTVEIQRTDLTPARGGMLQTYQKAADGGVGAADELLEIDEEPQSFDPARAVWTCQVSAPDPEA